MTEETPDAPLCLIPNRKNQKFAPLSLRRISPLEMVQCNTHNTNVNFLRQNLVK